MKIQIIQPGNPREAIENIKSVTDNALLEAYNNSYATYCLAGGHGKSEANKYLAEKYYTEIKKRGIQSRINKDSGRMNGNGSV
jgi:hypothetical protein